MPRATFGGVTFDLLVQGLQDTHEGMTTVREVPGSAAAAGPVAYVDLGGAMLPRRTVNILVDDEAGYLALARLPGTTGASGALSTDAGDQPAVLLSVARYYRRGAAQPNLCRTEWLLLPTAGGAPPETPAGLEDTRWVLRSLADPLDPGPLQPVLPGTTLSATFAGGLASGSAGCNAYTGGYTLDGGPDHLVLADVEPAGEDVCTEPDGIAEQETAYLDALIRVARYAVLGATLWLRDSTGAVLLLYDAAPPAALEGTAWRAVRVDDGTGGLVPVLAGTTVTAELLDGTLAGSAGCNAYTAAYTLDAEADPPTLTLDAPPVAGEDVCEEPAGIAEQETAYLTALEATAGYALVGDRLTLLREDATGLAVYTVAPAAEGAGT